MYEIAFRQGYVYTILGKQKGVCTANTFSALFCNFRRFCCTSGSKHFTIAAYLFLWYFKGCFFMNPFECLSANIFLGQLCCFHRDLL